MATEVTIKKWGNSMGVILPNSLIKEKNLKEDDKVLLLGVVKEANLSHVYGSLKGKLNISGQKFKDMVREGWEK
ncbi:hypothetical protein HQ489_02835 [Candidatus Woesearchaeota archaeon]|nr:hypothetical protein [Candidatus Woesearchaeota archaeon]